MTTNKTQKFIIILISAGLFAMLATSLAHRFQNRGLTITTLEQKASGNREAQMMTAIGALMQQAAQKPDDKTTLLKLVQNLMAIGEWQTAENFAQKVLALDSADTKALYLLAIIDHNLGHNEQAVELLEKLLEKEENPSARYSLGILYIHFLNMPDKGIQHLRKGLQYGSAPESLKTAIRQELEKAEKHIQ